MQIPQRLQVASRKIETGEFITAIQELNRVYDDRYGLDRLLKAELLLRSGDFEHAEDLTRRALEAKGARPDIRARAHEHIGYIERHRGKPDDAIRSWETSALIAIRNGDYDQCCRSQLHLLATKADAHGPESIGTLASDARLNATRAGSPYLWIMLHWRFAEVEARRSAFLVAERHVRLGLALLTTFPTLWLEARLELLYGVISDRLSRPDAALLHSSRALQAARQAGCLFVETAALANLGDLYTSAGDFKQARQHLEGARSRVKSWSVLRLGVDHNLARLALLEGNYDACEHLLELSPHRPLRPYARIESLLTRIQLLQKRGDLASALTLAHEAAESARQRCAYALSIKFLLTKADILLDLGRELEAREVLYKIDEPSNSLSLGAVADVERLQARISSAFGAAPLAQSKLERAKRLLGAVGRHVPERLAETTSSLRMVASSGTESVKRSPTLHDAIELIRSFASTISTIEFGCHPLLFGRELLALLDGSEPLLRRAALVRTHGGRRQTLQHRNWPGIDDAESIDAVNVFELGQDGDGAYQLWIDSSDAFGGLELVQLIGKLISMTVELHRFRQESLERASLWPSELYPPIDGPIFYSEKMQELRQQALRMAGAELTVLITGETGVGKEVIARLIHESSKRAAKQFVPINCASLPRELFETQLFGHRKGAFTGAISDVPGLLRDNDGGTVFFDEIGELSPDLQVKLLRVIDAHEIQPVGASQAITVDFRVVAATNADLHQLMEKKQFRDDLFYRLNVATLHIPPLRARREEILSFAHYFLKQYCTRHDKPLVTLSDETEDCLLLYDWPGNIRELRNEMEKLAGMADAGSRVKASDLKQEIRFARHSKPIRETSPNELVVRIDQRLDDAFDEIVRHAVPAALARNNNVYESAARDLGITRKGLYNKRIKLGMIPRPPAKSVQQRTDTTSTATQRTRTTRSRKSVKENAKKTRNPRPSRRKR